MIVAGAVVVSAIAAVTVAVTMIILLLVTGLLKVKLTMKARIYILDLAAAIAAPIALAIAAAKVVRTTLMSGQRQWSTIIFEDLVRRCRSSSKTFPGAPKTSE